MNIDLLKLKSIENNLTYLKTKKILVLDLDETLIYSSKVKLNSKALFIYKDYYVYARPHLNWFLHTIKSYFKIGIWSSADDLYVEHIVEKIISKEINLEFIWSKSWFNLDSHNGKQYLKKMSELEQLGYDLDELLLIDDNEENVIINSPHSILIKPFRGEVYDNELQKIVNQLIKK